MELLTQDELVRLTPPERLALISQLWDSMEDNQLPLTAAQRAELDNRLATLDQDRREGIAWTALKPNLSSVAPSAHSLSCYLHPACPRRVNRRADLVRE